MALTSPHSARTNSSKSCCTCATRKPWMNSSSKPLTLHGAEAKRLCVAGSSVAKILKNSKSSCNSSRRKLSISSLAKQTLTCANTWSQASPWRNCSSQASFRGRRWKLRRKSSGVSSIRSSSLVRTTAAAMWDPALGTSTVMELVGRWEVHYQSRAMPLTTSSWRSSSIKSRTMQNGLQQVLELITRAWTSFWPAWKTAKIRLSS
mmetsp:Transcript_35060/g.69288  ORF Transcript_35060/g.69288 Transcript_35060/m.69288 type:complete len:205 (+) Transcript_35060:341-955(+)